MWHFYFVVFNPDTYPMNMAWLTGRLTEREMEEEHPLELERLRGSASSTAPAEEKTGQEQGPTPETEKNPSSAGVEKKDTSPKGEPGE